MLLGNAKKRRMFFKIVLLSQNILTLNTFNLKRQDGFKDAAKVCIKKFSL